MTRLAATLALAVAFSPVPAGSAAPMEGDARSLPFISNDYARALGEARARDLPLFIEAWAPW